MSKYLIENLFGIEGWSIAWYGVIIAVGMVLGVILGRPGGKFCVSVFRQNQEYHVFNVHDGGLFPLVTSLPEGWDGMRADTA